MLTNANRDEIADLVKTGRRAQRRKKAALKVAGVMLTTALLVLGGGWELMLAVGIAHQHWVPALPTVGYWWAVLLVLLMRGVFASVRSGSKDDQP